MREANPINKTHEHSHSKRQGNGPYNYWRKVLGDTFQSALHLPNGIWFILACLVAPAISLFMNAPKIAILCAAAAVIISTIVFVVLAFRHIDQETALKTTHSPSENDANVLTDERGNALTDGGNPSPKPESKPAEAGATNTPVTPTPPKAVEKQEPVKATPPTGASSGSLLPSQIVAMHALDLFSFNSTGSGGIRSSMQYANEGEYVSWVLYLLDATSFWGPLGDSDLKIRCSEQPMDTSVIVVFNLPLFGHEYLKVSIDRYQMFSVVGTIAHIGANEILLKDVIMEPITNGL